MEVRDHTKVLAFSKLLCNSLGIEQSLFTFSDLMDARRKSCIVGKKVFNVNFVTL